MINIINKNIRQLTGALCCLGMSSAAFADSETLEQAQNLLARGESVAALDLLEPLENDSAGDKDYDYLLGVALLDTGNATESIFAFQRALALDPQFAGARIDLARAYFDLGELNESRREFQLVQSQQPPAEVQSVIERYLAAIDNRSLRDREGWRGYIQFGIGDDSNANNATSDSQFLGVPLTAESRAADTSVILTGGGITYDLPVSYATRYFFSGNINHRTNNQATFTNSVVVDFNAGVSQKIGENSLLGGGLQLYNTQVDGSSNNSGYMLNGQYAMQLGANNQVTGFARFGDISYIDQFSIRDVQQTALGASWIHVLNIDSRPSLNLSLVSGTESPAESNSPYGRDYLSMRLSTAFNISHRLNFYASVSNLSSDYDSAFFGAAENRSDDLTDLVVGMSWRPDKTWTIRPVIRNVSSTSNVALYEYDKLEFMVTVRSDFYP